MKRILYILFVFLIILPGFASALTRADLAQQVIATGKKYLGTPYQFGAPAGQTSTFDCSSFTQYIFGQHGIWLNRISQDQFRQGSPVSKDQLEPGDIVFFDTDFDGVVNHLGVFIGNGEMLHASSTLGVTISRFIDNPYWASRYAGARRVITNEMVNNANMGNARKYTVQPGDTLWIISNKTHTTVNQLMQWNGLSSDTIYSGQVLIVGFEQSNPSQPNDHVRTHTVAKGDTLYLIAQKYSISTKQLIEWNGLTTDLIYPGQVLKVEGVYSDGAAPVIHTVSAGETLWILSNRYGVTIQAIRDINHLKSDWLSIGQKLTIPL